ncbi:MAG: winged helix-turn-helix domain-containing protein, partial [Acidimicrobiia bacterium]|nr:winged helix-turn-helix domain-containing protein [Acidimicrobiia bacterium]
MVPKEELLDELWGDRFVSEWALSTAVKHARRALGDDGARQHIIKTSHGRGYRLVVPVERIEHRVTVDAGPSGRDDAVRVEPVDGSSPQVGALHRLPRPVTLLGRDGELKRLEELNEPRSAVTIVGPGGVGKTSLALKMAHELGEDGHDIWFCDLAAQDGDGVASEVLDVVDSTAGSGGVSIDRIAERPGHGRTTLFLDNCEHVIDAVRTLADGLLDRLPNLSIVATSRDVIRLPEERLVRLAGLRGGDPHSPAVQLFMRRGGQLGTMTGTDEDRKIAVRIVDRLDGLPLALELAATRLTSASPSEVLDALDDQLAVLRGGPGSERHSTMERTIDWSYRLLSPEEQQVLSELSVFRSPFRLDAATYVVEAEGVAEFVHRLVQCSMLSVVQGSHGTRFRMLEPIRQFIEERSEEGGLIGLRTRHAEYFAERIATLARLLHTSDEPVAAAALTAEWPDVVDTVRWGLDAGRPDIAVEPLVRLGFHIRWQQRTEAYGWLEAGLK